ncbi:hypothetical protein [Streptomyces paromomycinus]|uniref:hypothetical protein n=1 Tax=Streptomyces paromomycinus TaxID=92743 RepID=UPI001478C3F6|nr:hypothetical protein [Streptomyces paromomycinus]
MGLHYDRSASPWGFAHYSRAPMSAKTPSRSPAVSPAPTPEAALDCACGLDLTAPNT